MQFDKPKLIGDNNVPYEILSFEEFKAARGLLDLSNQTIDYNIQMGRLDYTTIGRFRYIIWNDKAKEFNLSYKKAKSA